MKPFIGMQVKKTFVANKKSGISYTVTNLSHVLDMHVKNDICSHLQSWIYRDTFRLRYFEHARTQSRSPI